MTFQVHQGISSREFHLGFSMKNGGGCIKLLGLKCVNSMYVYLIYIYGKKKLWPLNFKKNGKDPIDDLRLGITLVQRKVQDSVLLDGL